MGSRAFCEQKKRAPRLIRGGRGGPASCGLKPRWVFTPSSVKGKGKEEAFVMHLAAVNLGLEKKGGGKVLLQGNLEVS